MEKLNINILVVEDNLSYALEMEMMLNDLGYTQFKTVDNSADALEAIFSTDLDLIFMDIEIKGNLSGTQIGEKIRHLDIPIIFVTSFSEKSYYQAANASNIAGYLIKPASKFTLESTMQMALRNRIVSKQAPAEQPKETDAIDEALFIKKDKVFHKVFIRDIHHVEAEGNYSLIFTDDAKFISTLNFSKMESLLSPSVFIKIHRSHIRNMDFFSSINIEENTVSLSNGALLPISRSNKQKLLSLIKVG